MIEMTLSVGKPGCRYRIIEIKVEDRLNMPGASYWFVDFLKEEIYVESR